MLCMSVFITPCYVFIERSVFLNVAICVLKVRLYVVNVTQCYQGPWVKESGYWKY